MSAWEHYPCTRRALTQHKQQQTNMIKQHEHYFTTSLSSTIYTFYTENVIQLSKFQSGPLLPPGVWDVLHTGFVFRSDVEPSDKQQHGERKQIHFSLDEYNRILTVIMLHVLCCNSGRRVPSGQLPEFNEQGVSLWACVCTPTHFQPSVCLYETPDPEIHDLKQDQLNPNGYNFITKLGSNLKRPVLFSLNLSSTFLM